MVCKKGGLFLPSVTWTKGGPFSSDCLVFLSLEPSWHGRLTVKSMQRQHRHGEVKQSWHLVHTRSWEVSDLLQEAKPSELSRDPAHPEKRQQERGPAFKHTHPWSWRHASELCLCRTVIYCCNKQSTSNYYYLYIIIIITLFRSDKRG